MPNPPGLGLFYLAKSYKDEPPIDPYSIPGVTNPHMIGILWRESWDRLDKNGRGNHDFSFLDHCFGASAINNKTSSLEILAGNYAPPWFFALPGAKQIIAGLPGQPTTVPWDPVFQTEWEAVQTALAARYKNNPSLKYVKAIGFGFSSESFFAIFPDTRAQAEALAISM